MPLLSGLRANDGAHSLLSHLRPAPDWLRLDRRGRRGCRTLRSPMNSRFRENGRRPPSDASQDVGEQNKQYLTSAT